MCVCVCVYVCVCVCVCVCARYRKIVFLCYFNKIILQVFFFLFESIYMYSKLGISIYSDCIFSFIASHGIYCVQGTVSLSKE